MWASTAYTPSPDWLITSFNDQLSAVLNTFVAPSNVAESHSLKSSADTDAKRDLTPMLEGIEVVMVSPWDNGSHAGNKQNMNWYLSAPDAQGVLENQLPNYAWEGCVCFCVLADTPALFSVGLDALIRVFPNHNLIRAKSHSDALINHDSDKLFIPAVENEHRQKALVEQAAFDLSIVRQNLSISQAVASDIDPVLMLSDFKAKRVARLLEIKSGVTEIAAQSGPIQYILNLTSSDLASELSKVTAPNDHAPLCCLLAVGGTNQALAPLRKVLNL